MFLKLAGAGKDGVPFPHSSFFKTLKFFSFFFLFFVQIPFQFPLLPLQYRSRHPQAVRVGREWGTGPRKCRSGSGFEHHENGWMPQRAGGRAETAGRARTHTRAQGEPVQRAVPGGAGGWLVGAGGRGFPKMNK